jgi:hypothetical protein
MRFARTVSNASIAVVLTAILAASTAGAASAAAQRPASLLPVMNRAVAVAVGGAAGPVGYDYFYRNLAPHGYWAQRPNYGWVWMPRGVATGWRPYTAGRWAYSDAGWTWVSAESWGWATYHYGRWYQDPDYGWSWVPGTEWGPSWVSWQEGGNYLGWAPLPPAVGWNASVGLDLGGFNLSAGIAPSSYCFVPESSFLALNVGAVILPIGRNAEIFRNTTNFTNYGVVNGRAFNRGLAVERVQQFTGHPVPRYNLAAAANGGPRGDRLAGNSIAVFRPGEVVRRENGPDPAHLVPHAVATSAFLAHRAQEIHGADRADGDHAAGRRGAESVHGGAEGRVAANRETHGTAASHHAQASHQAVARRNAAHTATHTVNGAHRTTSSQRARTVHHSTSAHATHGTHSTPTSHAVTAHTRRPSGAQHQQAARHNQAAVHHGAPQSGASHHESSPPPQHAATEERSVHHSSPPPAQRHAPAPQAHHAPPPPAQRSDRAGGRQAGGEHPAAAHPPAQHPANEHEHPPAQNR